MTENTYVHLVVHNKWHYVLYFKTKALYTTLFVGATGLVKTIQNFILNRIMSISICTVTFAE